MSKCTSHERAASSIRPMALRHTLRFWIWEGVLAQPLVYLNQPGNFVLATLLAGTLALDPATYGALLSIPFWCNVVQLLLSPLLARYWSARGIMLSCMWATVVSWLAVYAVLDRYAESHGSVKWFAVTFSIACLLTSITGVAWTALMQRVVPNVARGVYFARRNRICQLALLAFILATVAVTEIFGRAVPVFCGVIAFACLTRAASIMFAHRTAVLPPEIRQPVPLTAQFSSLRQQRPFLLFVACGALWGMTANFAAPFLPVFFLRELHWSNLQVGAFFLASLLVGAMAFPGWGKLIQQHGARPAMFVALALWSVTNVCWVLITPAHTALPYLLSGVTGAANAGIVLCNFNLILKLMPPTARAMAVGLNTAITSLATALAPIAAGVLLSWSQEEGWNAVAGYRWLFIGQILPAAATALLLIRIREPATSSLQHALGAMRNIRTLGAVLGLGFLFEHLFPAPTPPKTKGRV
ncbi:MAG: hypothetical protein C0518_01850 [Opitutus sp.]|nr:hypothetical protein [Opitutus sp.]